MDVTHSSMLLNWDSAPGLVRKYIITYKPAEGESKEVSSLPITLAQISYHNERVPRLLVNVVPQELFILNNPSRFWSAKKNVKILCEKQYKNLVFVKHILKVA